MKKMLLIVVCCLSLYGVDYNEASKYTPNTYKLGVEHEDDKTTIIYNCKRNVGVVANIIKNNELQEHKVIWNNIRNGNVETLQCKDFNFWKGYTDTLVDEN